MGIREGVGKVRTEAEIRENIKHEEAVLSGLDKRGVMDQYRLGYLIALKWVVGETSQ